MKASEIKKVSAKMEIVSVNSNDVSCCIICEELEKGKKFSDNSMNLSSAEASEKMGMKSAAFAQHVWKKITMRKDEKSASISFYVCLDCLRRDDNVRGVKGSKSLYHMSTADYRDSIIAKAR